MVRNMVAAAVLTAFCPGIGLAAEIVPHQAMYRLKLQDLRVDGWADTSSGTMEINLTRDCFHYRLDRHIDFTIRYTDDRKTRIVIEERLREAVNGRNYWFWSRTTLNGKTVAIIAGDAARPEGGTLIEVQDETVEEAAAAAPVPKDEEPVDPETAKAEAEAQKAKAAEAAAQKAEDSTIEMRLLGVQVHYNWPDERRTEVDPAAIFPFTALRKQLESLEGGALDPELVVFDGLNKDDAFRAVYRPVQLETVANPIRPDGNAELIDLPAWRFSTEYFLLNSESRKPARVVTSKIHANGVVSDTVIDLGPFSFQGKLAWIKGDAVPDC